MRDGFSKLFCLPVSALLFLLAIGVLALRNSRPSVALHFIGFQTNVLSSLEENRDRVSALIEVTNRGCYAVTYRAYQKPEDAEHMTLYRVGNYWTNFDNGFRCGTRAGAALASGWTWRQFTLEPSRSFLLNVDVMRPRSPRKIVMVYQPVCETNGVYRILTAWLEKRLPWRRRVYSAACEPFTP